MDNSKFEDVILHILEAKGIEEVSDINIKVASEILNLLHGVIIIDATLILEVCKTALQYKVF